MKKSPILNLNQQYVSFVVSNVKLVDRDVRETLYMTSQSGAGPLIIKELGITCELVTPVTATITTLLTETSAGKFTSDEVATEDDHIVLT